MIHAERGQKAARKLLGAFRGVGADIISFGVFARFVGRI